MKQALAVTAGFFAPTAGAAPSHAEGNVKEGPNLFGVIGATAGKRAFSFELRHSAAMKESAVVWNNETLDGFLEDPQKFLPGTKMPFVGFRNKADRDDVIAYLKSATK